jgi:hypothetical protein
MEEAMRKPSKPGTEASKTREGGALGNIDELTGHPGKGTSGPSIKPSESPDPSKGVQPGSDRGKNG